MSYEYIIKTPHTKSHSHFYDYIEDFPHLHDHHDHHHDSKLPAQEKLLDHLRLELKSYAENPQYHNNMFCYRKCFTILNKEYVDYCLKRNCGSNLQDAAKFMGWAK